MAKATKPVPEGCHTVTPHLCVKGAGQFIEFCARAFGAREVMRMPGPDGQSIMHAEIQIGDSKIFLNDESPEMGALSPASIGGNPVALHLYVADCDALFAQAVAAGATVRMPLTDMFWGDRYGQIADPFGYVWALATHKEDLTADEMGRRAAAG